MGALLKPLGEYAQWEIAYSYPDERQNKDKQPNASTAARPRKIVTTKTGHIIHEEVTDEIKRVTQSWFTGTTQYYKKPASSLWYEARPGSEMAFQPSPSGLHDVEMVQAENYVGTVAYGKGKCLVFSPGGSQKGSTNDLRQDTRWMESADIIAYVDAESRFPVAVRVHGILRTYLLDSPPVEMQTVPVDLADQIKRGEEGRARLNAVPARPY